MALSDNLAIKAQGLLSLTLNGLKKKKKKKDPLKIKFYWEGIMGLFLDFRMELWACLIFRFVQISSYLFSNGAIFTVGILVVISCDYGSRYCSFLSIKWNVGRALENEDDW